MDETPAQRRRLGAALVIGLALTAAVLAWPKRARDLPPPAAPAATPTTAAPTGPASAGALVPREARGVLRLDVAAMRRTAAFAGWFEAVRSSDDPCAIAVGERVTRVVVAWTTTALEDFTVVAEGPVDEPTFRRCGGAQNGRIVDVQTRIEAGVPVLALSTRPGDGGRAAHAETWRTAAGTLVLGSPEALRAMLIEGRAHPVATEVTPDLAGLWADVPAGALAAGVRRLSPDAAADPALAHARSVSAWVEAEGGSTVLSAVVRCDTAAGATAVAGALAAARQIMPDFSATADDDRVRVRATVDPAMVTRALSSL